MPSRFRSSRLGLFFLCLLALSISATAQDRGGQTRGGSISPVDSTNAFVHITAEANLNQHQTTLISEPDGSSPLLTSNPNAMVFLTRNVSASTATHAESYGVYYTGVSWNIFNQNVFNMMPAGVAFNAQVMGKGDSVFVHTVTEDNRPDDFTQFTVINHPLLNGDSDASEILIVMPTWNGVYNDNEIGVYYDPSKARWTIFNQDADIMPIGATFNVQIIRDADTGIRHQVTAENTVSTSKTLIDNIFLNNSPNVQFIVTQNWSLGGVYNDHPIGVEYDGTTNRWMIVNLDGAAMPVGAGFNIHIIRIDDGYGDGVLLNGGFEVPAATKNTAIKWNTTKAGSGSKRVCNKYAPKSPTSKQFTPVGECAYLLKGLAGTTRKITQVITLPPTISGNNTIDLIGIVKGVNAVKAKAKGVVLLSDGSKVSYVLPLNGTYDWVSKATSVSYNPATQPVKLTLNITIGGGTVYLDYLSSAIFEVVP